MMGFFVPFFYMKNRALEGGMEPNLSSLTISVIGVANTFARIFCGLLSSFKGIDANVLSNIAITAGGIFTICSGFYITPFYQFSYAVTFGITIGEYLNVRCQSHIQIMYQAPYFHCGLFHI